MSGYVDYWLFFHADGCPFGLLNAGQIAADWTRIRSDGPWRAESRIVGEWKAADGG